MQINNRNVTGIKKAVGEANRCVGDRWAIILNPDEAIVSEVEAIGNDDFVTSESDVMLTSGRTIYGDRITMTEVVRRVAQAYTIIDQATADYNRGMRHTWKIEAHKEAVAEGLADEDDEYETLAEFVRDCLNQW